MTQKNDPNVSYLRGTNRPDRLSGDTSISMIEEPLDTVPPPPLWLPNHFAVSEWMRLCPILIKLKLLTPGSLSALAQLCALHGNVVTLYSANLAPSASMLGALRNLHNDFGLSPLAQGKVNPEAAKPEEKPNSFSKRGRKPA